MVSWMPNWVKRKMGIQIPKTKEEVMAEQFELAQKEGLYDKDWMGYSEINKDALAEGVKSGKIQKEMLQAILADKDLSKDDTEFMQKLVKQATEEGSLFTHDQGLHDRLDRIFPAKDKNPKWTPSQKDSQRASEILRSNNVGTGSAPPMIINNTTQNVSQGDTNSTVVTIPDGETESFPGFGQRTKIA
jgi:predicted RND superfamily exporter protein